ncbi:Transmembrane and TPR repeat-containing protein 2 [Orchesella cincta]|uniref:dolichyl-phosphate-mannose--protein mannosyltransferase n=1 Tax=Orchesella cincta TaxID=48709 RepID=A0A1D2NLT1_ORCCI|nr:Transmembrane and TPR repeat-containing protein 2 [Orchesella cincta]
MSYEYEKRRAILTNPDIRPETPWSNLLHNDFWGTPLQNSGSHKSYRPLTILSFRLNFLLSGLNPWPYHLTNVLLHTLTTWLFVRVARLVFCSKSCLYLNTLCTATGAGRFSHNTTTGKSVGGSCQRKGRIMEVTSSRNLAVLLSSLLFALHPIHTEAVAGLVGRADVGSTAFALLSFISYVKFVKFRDKARISSALITRSYSTRSHSPLCPNKNKKAGYNNNQQQNHHHHHYYQQQQQEQQSDCHSVSGFGSIFTRFTNILTSFSSFLLLRMKMFVVNRDEKSTSAMTTTKGTSDNAGGNGGYSRTKGNCDNVNGVGVFGGVSGSGLSGGVGCAVIWLWLQCAMWFVFSVGFATAAMLTKEQGITILLVCATFDLVRSLVRTRHLYQEWPSILRLECVWSVLLLALSSICLLYLRLHLMGPNFAPPVFSKADNSIAHQPNFWIRVGTFLFLPVFNFGLIIFPHPLSYDWSMNAIPPIQSFWELRNLVSLSFYVILLKIIYSRTRSLISSSKDGVTVSSTPKKGLRSRRDFLSLTGHSSQNDSGLPTGNPSSHWWPSSSWCCSSPSSSITSSNSSASSSLLPSSTISDDASATMGASTYPAVTGNGPSPSRKDYCNVCHLWMSSSRKQHQHNNNNSIWNGGPEYLQFCGSGGEQERDCDTSSNSSRSSSSGSSTSSSNGNGHTGYNRLISNGHQGRSNHYRSSGNSPTASAHHQNLRYRVTTNGGGSSNISNGFGNGSPAYLSPTGNNTMRNNNSKSFTFSSSDCSGESSTISRSSEASAALLSSSLLLQLSFLILPFLPATNLFFYVGFVVAERVLYMPSVGFCLLMGQGFLLVWHRLQCQSQHHQQKQTYHHHQKQRYHSSNNSSRGQGHRSRSYYGSIPSGNHNNSKRQSLRKLFVLSVITSLFVLSLRTMKRNEDWEDEGKLYKAGIEVNPPKSWGNLGIVLSNQGKLKEAEQAYRKALHFRSNLADVHYNL